VQSFADILQWQVAMGIEDTIGDIPSPLKTIKPVRSRKPANTDTPVVETKPSLDEANTTRKLADSCNTLEELRMAVFAYKGLAICETATNVVFSDGNPLAKVMLIGEAPGATEDETGIPFCGESGQLLDKALGFAGLYRKDNLYITNTVFWRPPGNRTPTDRENLICKPFVEKHIALIKPDILLLCGGNSLMTLMGNNCKITKEQGRTLSYTNEYLDSPIKTYALYHPSFLLRQPMKKREFWFNLLKIFNK
jgi:uracil-DNA glycosylase